MDAKTQFEEFRRNKEAIMKNLTSPLAAVPARSYGPAAELVAYDALEPQRFEISTITDIWQGAWKFDDAAGFVAELLALHGPITGYPFKVIPTKTTIARPKRRPAAPTTAPAVVHTGFAKVPRFRVQWPVDPTGILVRSVTVTLNTDKLHFVGGKSLDELEELAEFLLVLMRRFPQFWAGKAEILSRKVALINSQNDTYKAAGLCIDRRRTAEAFRQLYGLRAVHSGENAPLVLELCYTPGGRDMLCHHAPACARASKTPNKCEIVKMNLYQTGSVTVMGAGSLDACAAAYAFVFRLLALHKKDLIAPLRRSTLALRRAMRAASEAPEDSTARGTAARPPANAANDAEPDLTDPIVAGLRRLEIDE